MQNQKITIYKSTDAMGDIAKYEGTLLSIITEPYAQYDKSTKVSFVPKGKRNGVSFRLTRDPYLLILKGWGHPDPDDAFILVKQDETVKISKSRYMAFDDKYELDFDDKIAPYLIENSNALLSDFRHTKGFVN